MVAILTYMVAYNNFVGNNFQKALFLHVDLFRIKEY